MKKVTIFKEGSNVSAVFHDGRKRTEWDKLMRDEQIDLLEAMRNMYNFLLRFVKEEGGGKWE